MQMFNPFVVTLAVALLSSAANVEGQVAPDASPADTFKCELTKANGRYPDSQAWGKGSNFYGNESIAIGLGPEGQTLVFEPGGPGAVLPDGSLRYKILWAKARLPMTIEGRRLDASAPPLRSRVSNDHADDNFQPSALIFPTPGCWEITSRVGQSALTFVVKVVKIGNGPDPLTAWLRMDRLVQTQSGRDPAERLRLAGLPW